MVAGRQPAFTVPRCPERTSSPRSCSRCDSRLVLQQAEITESVGLASDFASCGVVFCMVTSKSIYRPGKPERFLSSQR
jgi:hypothetical protein